MGAAKREVRVSQVAADRAQLERGVTAPGFTISGFSGRKWR